MKLLDRLLRRKPEHDVEMGHVIAEQKAESDATLQRVHQVLTRRERLTEAVQANADALRRHGGR